MPEPNATKDNKVGKTDTRLKRICNFKKDQLNNPTGLQMLYIDNNAVPERLRSLMKNFIEEKFTKDEMLKKLDQLSNE